MKQSTRIKVKVFLKKQIENGKISKREIFNIQAEDLSEINELKDIDMKTSSKTLDSIKELIS